MTPLDGALAAVSAGWSVFPLARGSKLPAIPRNMGGKGVHDATTDQSLIAQWSVVPDLNWGIACGPSNLLVIDVDPKNGGTADVLDQLPASLTVRTPSGGWHIYFQGQSANRVGLLPGVDVRSLGGYVVAPGSVTAAGVYLVERSLPVAKAPDWLVAAIGSPKPRDPLAASQRFQGEPPASAEVRAVIDAFAAVGPPKGGGHDVLFCVTEILARGTWPDEAIVDAVSAISVAIGRPASEGARVSSNHLGNREAGQTGRYGKPRLVEIYGADAGPLIMAIEPPSLGLGTPTAPAAPAPLSQPSTGAAPAGGAWTLLEGSLMGAPYSVERALKGYRAQHQRRAPGTEPELSNSSAVIKWLANAKGWTPDRIAAELGRDAGEFAVTLRSPEVQSIGRLTKIDQLLGAHELLWNEMSLGIEIDGEPWTDNHTAKVRIALEQCGASDPEKPIPNGDIEQRARALATPYHPVAEYLGALPAWDGVPRVDVLWTHYFGAENNDLNRKLGACFAIAAVRRVLEPGTKVDMMPILYGRQGAFKSSGLSALVGGPPFFTDAAPGFGHRSENAMTLAGCWVWEIAEMQGMDRADQNAVKAFVTRQEDDVLLPYARAKSRLHRRSITVGTTNDEACLNDPTGSRRHPVIEIGTIAIEDIRRDRDQFWSEAVMRMRSAEPHWLSAADESRLVSRNEEKHTKTDEVVIAGLQDWFALPPEQRFRSEYERRFPAQGKPDVRPEFTVAEALKFAFGGKLDRAGDVRVGLALRVLGVEWRRAGKNRIRRYAFPS